MGSQRYGARVSADGWATFERWPGWESYSIRIRAAVVEGRPRAVALSLEPVDGAEYIELTSVRLRALPATQLATIALGRLNTTANPDLRKALRGSKPKPERHDPRALTTVEEVAEAWNRARARGTAQRSYVMSALGGISARTADRYIARAREAGLIPVESRSAPRLAGRQS